MDFIEDGYPLGPKETEMIQEATERHTEFYKGIYRWNAELESDGEPVQTVRVMTQNMHARPEPFESAIAGWVIDNCDPAYNFENRQTDRVINFAKSIKTLQADIIPHVICFQELQGSKDKVMYDNLTRRDPADTIAYKRVDQCDIWDISTNKIKSRNSQCLPRPRGAFAFLPGGITTYSTLDIVFQTYHTFKVGTGGENAVSKGVLYSKIKISKPNMPEKFINVLNCHPLAPITFTRGECERGVSANITNAADPRNCSTYELRKYQNDQLKEIYKFKQSLQAGGVIQVDQLVVYAGDMNINQYMALWETKQQEEVKTATTCCGEEFYSLLTKLKAEHPPVYLNPVPSGIGGHNGIFTWDGGENAITQSLLWPKSYTWIDYVLYSIENAKPLYADNFIVRFKQAEKLYEHGQLYQKECFDKRNKDIKDLQKKPRMSIKDYLSSWQTTFFTNALTNPDDKKLKRLQKFQEGTYGTEFIDAIEQNPELFYTKTPKNLTMARDFKPDDNPKTTRKINGYQSKTAFEDVSDHYGVIATFILPSSQESLVGFNKLMKNRFNEKVQHELFFNLPLQPIVVGINDNGKALRLASRMDPRSPKMDNDLWNRQTGVGRLIQYSTDSRISRAAHVSNLNVTAALNEKVYTVDKPRLKGKFAYADCRDDDDEECIRKHPSAFDSLTHIRPILRLTDLKAMGIQDVDARYRKANRYREEPVMVQLATPRVRRQQQMQAFTDNVQDRDSLGMPPPSPQFATPPLGGDSVFYQPPGTPRRTPVIDEGSGDVFSSANSLLSRRDTPRGTPRGTSRGDSLLSLPRDDSLLASPYTRRGTSSPYTRGHGTASPYTPRTPGKAATPRNRKGKAATPRNRRGKAATPRSPPRP
jgi:hypothetical protein